VAILLEPTSSVLQPSGENGHGNHAFREFLKALFSVLYFFTVYISLVASTTSHFGVQQQQYADDTQLYISISKPVLATNLQVLESALSSLSAWFFHNGLALNPGNSDAILLGTNSRNHSLLYISSVNVSGSIIYSRFT